MRFGCGLVNGGDGAGWSFVLAILPLLLAAGSGASAQRSDGKTPGVPITVPSSGSAECRPIFREIDDPHSGARWLLRRDAANPGGPGRLELARPARDLRIHGKLTKDQSGGRTARALVIRPGDKLVVEEHTATVEGYLEAVALGPASVGSALEVRLKIGGKVAHAVAVEAGRAALASNAEARR